MWKLLQYYGKYQSARGVLSDMPGWARALVLLAALPGLALILLSLLAFCVSVLALLLLTVPLYQLLRSLTGAGPEAEEAGSVEVMSGGPFAPFGDVAGPGRKRVEATVVEPEPPVEREDTQSDESRVSHG